MEGQMTIFDFIKRPNDLDTIEEKDMVQIVSARTGLDFKYVDAYWGWACKRKGIKFRV